MGRLTQAERDKLPESAFAWPEKRLYPVTSQDDVDSAAHLIGKAPASAREKIKKRILEICKAKGYKPPESWQDEAKLSAEFGHGLELAADFAAEGGEKVGPKKVRRRAEVLFRVGEYPFKHLGKTFTMTPEDVLAAVAGFTKPIPIDDNHRPETHPDGRPAPSYFKPGDFGEVVALTPFSDYTGFGCEIDFPEWLDAKHRDAAGKPLPMPLSAHFLWDTKELSKVALTPNPRIPDAAALFAAFAAEEAKMDTTEKTPHGQKMMQFIHDHTAMHGAVCKGENSPNVAGFTAEHELASMQKIHDLTLGSGAACAIYKENLGKNKAWRPGQYYDTAVSMMPRYSEYRPGQYALMTADEAAAFARQQAAAPPPPADTPEVAALKQQLATFAAERQAEKDRLESERRAADRARIAAEAVAFADALFHDDRIVAAEHPGVVTTYRLTAEADAHAPATATFTAEDGSQRSGTRLDAFKARELSRPKHVLTTETVADDRTVALFNRTHTQTDAEAERAEAVKKAEEHAARRNKLNGVARN